MQIEIIPSKERGISQNDWLVSRHSFSFDAYYDPKRLSFGSLRVFNEDWVKPGQGFPSHHHENMEIVTFVLSGSLEHQDSEGHQQTLRAKEWQRMSAGQGITHSERNPSRNEAVHFLQIWIFPSERDLIPSYQQKKVAPKSIKNQLHPVVSGRENEESLYIHQDASILYSELKAGKTLKHIVAAKKGIFLFVIKGEIQLEDHRLATGDSARIIAAQELQIKAKQDSELLLIEVNISVL